MDIRHAELKAMFDSYLGPDYDQNKFKKVEALQCVQDSRHATLIRRWQNAKIGPEGTSPYLNSNHPGIVVISMVGGSARTISENIDKRVYLQLMTPDATRLRNTGSTPPFLPENPLSGDSF